jgi:hypothetical protein
MSADVAFGGVPHVALSGTSALVVSHSVSGLVRAIATKFVTVRGLRGAPPQCFRRLTTWWEDTPSNVPRLIGQSVQDLGAASIEIAEAGPSTLAEWRQARTIMTTSEEDGGVPADEVTSRRSVRTTTQLGRAHLRRLGALADDPARRTHPTTSTRGESVRVRGCAFSGRLVLLFLCCRRLV